MRSLSHLALLAAVLPAQALGAASKAQFHVEHASFDFGSVLFGQPVSHRFAIRNDGDSPLLVKDVSSSCGCVHANFEPTIAPGEAGAIRLDVDTSGLEGPVFLRARVHTGDPVRPTLTLEIKGFVNGPIMVLPRDHLDLVAVQGEEQDQTLMLEINRNLPLRILRVESSDSAFAARWETVQPGKRYRIAVRASAARPPGLHRGTLSIHTDDASRPILRIGCSLLVVSSVVAEPETLFLPPLEQEEARRGRKSKSWKVVIKNIRGRPFSILGLTSDLPFVRAWNEARPDGKSYDVFVAIDANQVLRPGRTVGSLHVRTNLPDAGDLKVPVWVEVR